MEKVTVANLDSDLPKEIEELLSERELRFARGRDGLINQRYALEAAIDALERRAARYSVAPGSAGAAPGYRAY